ncbi:MAG: HAD-IB family hydrolase [Peptostreptococcaceae bacterium]|nr:HAD-IB family hydrolase [Peptostreptococcaceae bacterium]
MNKRTAAFFDIDGTIFRDSLMIAHFRKMREYGIINDLTWCGNINFSEERWQKRRLAYDDFLDDISKAYVESLMGVSYGDIMFTARHTMRSRADEVYRFTKHRIQKHRELGHMVIFISGSPDFLVRQMANIWKADVYMGSKYIFQKGVFTGEIVPMWDSVSKLKAIRQLVADYDIDLEQSFAYGDTNGDLTMLQSVGHPFAINPAKELLDKISGDEKLSEKTTIVVERKDVIYQLRADTATFDLSRDEDLMIRSSGLPDLP